MNFSPFISGKIGCIYATQLYSPNSEVE